MLDQGNNSELPVIPAKRYFTIGEVSLLCGHGQRVVLFLLDAVVLGAHLGHQQRDGAGDQGKQYRKAELLHQLQQVYGGLSFLVHGP